MWDGSGVGGVEGALVTATAGSIGCHVLAPLPTAGVEVP